MQLPRPSFILMDIEGTTTAIDFVHKVLFPYSAAHMSSFIAAHGNEPHVAACLQAAADILTQEGGGPSDRAAVEAALLRWIAEDRKVTPLKELQGYLWRDGYTTKAYEGHVYPDVVPALQQWRAAGIGLGIYSSGSVAAQKLLFGHSCAGDLTGYFKAYFDTTSGGKRESASYSRIATSLELPPSRLLFLSDIKEELEAAAAAGYATVQIVRPSMTQASYAPACSSFADLKFAP